MEGLSEKNSKIWSNCVFIKKTRFNFSENFNVKIRNVSIKIGGKLWFAWKLVGELWFSKRLREGEEKGFFNLEITQKLFSAILEISENYE